MRIRKLEKNIVRGAITILSGFNACTLLVEEKPGWHRNVLWRKDGVYVHNTGSWSQALTVTSYSIELRHKLKNAKGDDAH